MQGLTNKVSIDDDQMLDGGGGLGGLVSALTTMINKDNDGDSGKDNERMREMEKKIDQNQREMQSKMDANRREIETQMEENKKEMKQKLEENQKETEAKLENNQKENNQRFDGIEDSIRKNSEKQDAALEILKGLKRN